MIVELGRACRPLATRNAATVAVRGTFGRGQRKAWLGSARSFHSSQVAEMGEGKGDDDAQAEAGVFSRFKRFAKAITVDEGMSQLLDRKEDEAGHGEKPILESKCGPIEEDDDEDDYVDMFNPVTGEWNGPRSGEPTRYGDWAHKGRATDFE
mmetsp:Transcript_6893/g.12181  ORF Transcript_6893/g.12181 Transcript_6893/m.12181 type:complete len:152 (-) Transcript_6893:33-488(-)